MMRDRESQRRSGGRRLEAANSERGTRARAHLARARERERRRLARQGRERARARRLQGSPDPWPRARRTGVRVLAVALGLLLAAIFGESLRRGLGPDFGAVESIAVQGHVRMSADEIASATGVVPGAPLDDVDPVAVQARLAAMPWIRGARVLRLPPSTLIVRVDERTPAAVLVPEVAGQPERLVDADGTPFASTRIPAELPRLVGGDELADGVPDPELATGLALWADLDARGVRALAGADGRLALHLPHAGAPEGWVLRGAAEVVLGRDALAERFDRLRRLIESSEWATTGQGKPVRIDLRFADQAVLSEVGSGQRG